VNRQTGFEPFQPKVLSLIVSVQIFKDCPPSVIPYVARQILTKLEKPRIWDTDERNFRNHWHKNSCWIIL